MAGETLLNKERPLAGVVLCFTSILPEQRTELCTIADEMGASHKLDLTSDVTHLLVGEICTPKYKFVARNRPDVTVMKPEWIQAVRQSWMEGEDTDIRALEEQYKLPPFPGLSICITGFEDMADRTSMQKAAIENGAEFSSDLSKDMTHLVARVAAGEKYKFAIRWNVTVVSEKWFHDCIERGMILEESLYHPLLPPEQQGIGAWNRSLPKAKGKAVGADGQSNPRPRKLRRIASTKLGDQNESIWGDIVGSGFDNSQPKAFEDDQEKEDNVRAPRSGSVIQEAKSFASESPFPDAQEAGGKQPTAEAQHNRPDGFLHGCYFFIHGFTSKQTSVLRQHLQFNGAHIVNSLSDFSRPEIPKNGDGLYIIVSYKTPMSEVPSTDDYALECEVVTDMWLERCLDSKALVSPGSHVASTPCSEFPIPGFHGMRICSTGFTRIDLLHLSKLVNLMGASYDEYLTPKASVLVCNDPTSANQEKLRHTREWGVPAVSADWLWTSIQTGQKKPFELYLVQKPMSHNDMNGRNRPEYHPPRQYPDQLKELNGNAQTGIRDNSPRPVAGEKTKPDLSSRAKKIPERQIEPVTGDGFLKEAPDKSRNKPAPRPKPTSPKQQHKTIAESPPNARHKQPEPNPSTTATTVTTGPSSFGLELNGILERARAAKPNPETTNNPIEYNSNNPTTTTTTGRRRRKPLIGRANSTTDQSITSRASSIDTLNEDACGSIAESVNTNTDGTNNHNQNHHNNGTTTRTGLGRQHSTTSLLSGGKLNFADDPAAHSHSHSHSHSLYPHYEGEGEVDGGEEEEEEAPPMTQLDYEDPDAAAMREEFLQSAGRVVEKKPPPVERGIIVGLEDIGRRGNGNLRRTRQAGRLFGE